MEHKAPLVGRAARVAGLQPDRLTVRDLASEIEWAKVSLVSPDDYVRVAADAGRPAPAGVERRQVVDVMRAYEEAKTESVVLDFEDILLLLADIIGRHGEVGEQIRRQYRHFVVDEYQDVSPLQQFLLEQWMGDRNELCVVGDPAQTIYSFAGASPQHLLGFTRTHPNATVVRLVRDYRSTPQVVNLANGLMAQRGAAGMGVELVSQRPSGPDPAYLTYEDDAAEAAGVAERISRLVAAGTSASEIAVLYRMNTQSEAIEEALSSRGIGYLVRGGQRFFDREEVRKAMVLLRGAAVAPSDEPLGSQVRSALADAGWTEEPPAARGAVRERWDSLQSLVQARRRRRRRCRGRCHHARVRRAHGGEGPGTARARRRRRDADHHARGQGPRVGCGLHHRLLGGPPAGQDGGDARSRRGGTPPALRGDHPCARAPPPRLARARKEGGRATRKRTRFLDRWWPDATRPRPRRATTTDSLRDLDADQLRLYEALKAWRLAIAQRDAKPAFTVFVDSTLVEIAQRRPGTRGSSRRCAEWAPPNSRRTASKCWTWSPRPERHPSVPAPSWPAGSLGRLDIADRTRGAASAGGVRGHIGPGDFADERHPPRHASGHPGGDARVCGEHRRDGEGSIGHQRSPRRALGGEPGVIGIGIDLGEVGAGATGALTRHHQGADGEPRIVGGDHQMRAVARHEPVGDRRSDADPDEHVEVRRGVGAERDGAWRDALQLPERARQRGSGSLAGLIAGESRAAAQANDRRHDGGAERTRIVHPHPDGGRRRVCDKRTVLREALPDERVPADVSGGWGHTRFEGLDKRDLLRVEVTKHQWRSQPDLQAAVGSHQHRYRGSKSHGPRLASWAARSALSTARDRRAETTTAGRP
ncbi:hypothetical protein GCM10025876_26680 [Demequina litorisediminis]|uniref:DNA 3'-5' helicase n=1 Tax=Demequina litorisediminis TaxID=1849022 RepID=A0ABQ6IIC2_9MICO|nr:hypothetical protein GCM10025876_26680 [Demequina litorisediminis]